MIKQSQHFTCILILTTFKKYIVPNIERKQDLMTDLLPQGDGTWIHFILTLQFFNVRLLSQYKIFSDPCFIS